MAKTLVGFGLLVLGCVTTAVCLHDKTSMAIYIEADGSATWTLLSTDIVGHVPTVKDPGETDVPNPLVMSLSWTNVER